MRKDSKADTLVQVYLSFFSLAKVICLAKKVSKGTFESIVSPWKDPDSVINAVGNMKRKMKYLLQRYVPDLPTIPLHQGMTWDPTWKALPTHSWVSDKLFKKVQRRVQSVLTSLAYELAAFQFLVD